MDTLQYIPVLTGADIDLHLLVHCFKDGRCKVVCTELPDVGTGLFFHMVARDLQLAPVYEAIVSTGADGEAREVQVDVTWNQARDLAGRLLNSMHGAARLVRAQYHPVSISSMHKYGLDGRWMGSSCSSPWGDRKYAFPPERTGLTELVRDWAEKGFDDEAVSLALSIYGSQPLSWTMLYMVYEVIKDDMGGDLSTFISSTKLSSFTGAANNARDLRSGPRHAKRTAVDQDSLMSVHEAERVVRHLLNHWLGAKVGKVMR